MEKGKDLASMLVAKMPMKKDSMAESSEQADTMEEGKMAAAEGLMSAMQSGDPKALIEAFKDMIDLCY